MIKLSNLCVHRSQDCVWVARLSACSRRSMQHRSDARVGSADVAESSASDRVAGSRGHACPSCGDALPGRLQQSQLCKFETENGSRKPMSTRVRVRPQDHTSPIGSSHHTTTKNREVKGSDAPSRSHRKRATARLYRHREIALLRVLTSHLLHPGTFITSTFGN